MSAVFRPTTGEELLEAWDLWERDTDLAMSRYGSVKDWDVSQVQNKRALILFAYKKISWYESLKAIRPRERFCPTTGEELRKAQKLWKQDMDLAISRYGDQSTWDASQIEDKIALMEFDFSKVSVFNRPCIDIFGK